MYLGEVITYIPGFGPVNSCKPRRVVAPVSACPGRNSRTAKYQYNAELCWLLNSVGLPQDSAVVAFRVRLFLGCVPIARPYAFCALPRFAL